MSHGPPVIRTIRWIAAIPQLLAALFAAAVGHWLYPYGGAYFGLVAYLIYSIGSRQLIVRDHRTGIRLLRHERYADAIPRFEASLAFLDRHPWIDKYRSVVLMSPAAWSYREMAFNNLALCYSQLGDGQRARECYQACLDFNPKNWVATAALRLMDTAVASATTAH